VVDFGVFVDTGGKQDGLVHVSQMTDRHVKNALGVVSHEEVSGTKLVTLAVKNATFTFRS
jgi:uncharacterized protein